MRLIGVQGDGDLCAVIQHRIFELEAQADVRSVVPVAALSDVSVQADVVVGLHDDDLAVVVGDPLQMFDPGV
ncbi:hypothetical protein ASF28_12005 [Methylobacterium sp. Leaf99]|uniref:hypothetical protein n=1 Tax=unclassified Methylobacterium TaxID=2615210 RepID=UPI0006F9E443|nr:MULTISPECIES: hypothetical protein [unclassified Methylobacterium]KQP07826.1 hypothetical protein ASF28_12005 [Methylobacterium sp. Leaf99]TXM76489.1 hypothetical protein FV218_06925 [Methylobacterium sp. WL69]